jgi:radical SAM protein with 4Fe4S-binding SPASM domain
MKEVSYGTFSAHLHSAGFAAHTPLDGTIEMTHRCPLTCSHCYNNLPMSDAAAQRRELTRDEHFRIVDELAEAGCLWLLYTGGEIFARRDFLEIYTHARQSGILLTLFTNGTMITPRVADYLAEHRPFSMEITLYGHTRQTYEQLTGIPGSFDKCRRGIELLLERKLPLKLKTVAVSINCHEMWDMQKFAEDLGLEFKSDSMMNPRIDCSQSPLAVRLTPEEVVSFDMQDPKRVDEWKLFAETHFQRSNPSAHSNELYSCGGGVAAFSIDPYGDMSICVLSQQDKFNLRELSVRDAWDALRGVRHNKKVTRPTKCTECELKEMCGMCPATAELETGDPEAPVDFLCRVAHLRAYSFGLTFGAHGECEYCEGGSGYEELMEAAARLRQLTPQNRKPLMRKGLPMLQQSSGGGCSSGGCSSCGTH